jgi:HD domain-containing protein
MPVQREIPRTEGGDVAEVLARRLSEAVHNVGNGNGAVNGDRQNGVGKERARRVAADVGAAMLAEASTGTAEHSNDVVLITEAIGQRMDVVGDYAFDLLAAARLHDIGKAWVPRDVLHKAGPLSVEEWELMRQHTIVGEQILSSVEELREVARLVRHSHERWDGHGYPDGLTGPEIPLGSRIIFCADAFHAIRCDRPYRAGRSAREALAEIKRNAGTQFDPQVADALERVVYERNRRPMRGGGSARLFALLMCLVVGGAGTAIARSGALGEVPAPPAAGSSPPPACGTAACPSVAGPVGGLGPVGALSGQPGPRPLFPGLPGQLHRAQQGNNGKHLAKGHHKNKPGNQKGKGKGHGKGKAKGHDKGHGNASASTGHSSDSSSAYTGSSSYGSGGSGGGHGSSGHGSSRHPSRGGSRGHGGGSTVSHGNGNANGHSK